MSTLPGRDEPTAPSEIPTALMEQSPFDEDEGTVADDLTTSETHASTPSAEDTPTLRKFRRPSPSEIAQAVDQVNTEAVDVEALARAKAAVEDDDED